MDERMTPSQLKARVLPALLAGSNRREMELGGLLDGALSAVDEQARLRALSLTGQALRFERPRGPERYLSETPLNDTRRIVPDTLRRPMVRLLSSSKITSEIAPCLAWAMDTHGLRPHPFDLPRLDAFVHAHSEYLGVTAEQWAKRKGSESADAFDAYAEGVLDDTTWSAARLRHKLDYIEQRRTQDANAARALIEAAWAQQDAESRVRLLMALQNGLAATDEPFLTSLGKDRSPRVRTVATRLLGRLTGSTEQSDALRKCLERIQRSETGVFRKRPVLKLELPANVKEPGAPPWVRGLFAEVSIEELASSQVLSAAELVEAAKEDRYLLLGLAWMATDDRRFDVLTKVAEELPELWELMSDGGAPDLALLPQTQRMQWAEIITRPVWSKPLQEDILAWGWLHRAIRAPVPDGLIQGMLRTNWQDDLRDAAKARPDWPEMLAACASAAQRPRLREQLAGLDSLYTANALSLLEILDMMETL